jgi:hypothetical protein
MSLLTFASIASGQEVLRRLPTAIVDIQISPDSRYTARVYANGTVEVLENSTGQIVFRQPSDLELYSASLDWSPDGRSLGAGIGTTISMWDTETWQLTQQLEATGREAVAAMDGYYIAEGFNSMEWNPQGTLLFAEMESAWLFVWDVPSYELLVNQNIGNNPTAMTWLPDGIRITNGESTFDIATESMNFEPRTSSLEEMCCLGVPTSIAVNPDGTQIAIGDVYGNIRFVDAVTLDPVGFYPYLLGNDPVHSINAISWNSDSGQLLFVGSGSVLTMTPQSGEVGQLAQIDGELFAGDWATNGAVAVGGVSNDLAIYGSSEPIDSDSTTAIPNRGLTFETFDPALNTVSDSVDMP